MCTFFQQRPMTRNLLRMERMPDDLCVLQEHPHEKQHYQACVHKHVCMVVVSDLFSSETWGTTTGYFDARNPSKNSRCCLLLISSLRTRAGRRGRVTVENSRQKNTSAANACWKRRDSRTGKGSEGRNNVQLKHRLDKLRRRTRVAVFERFTTPAHLPHATGVLAGETKTEGNRAGREGERDL